MKTGILWGTRDNTYKSELFIFDSDEGKEAERMANIIENYIAGHEQSPECVLGVWDPFQIIEDEDISKLTYKNFFKENVRYKNKYMIPTFIFFTYYSPDSKGIVFPRENQKNIGSMINVCTGWQDNKKQKISLRLNAGITEPLSKLRKKQQTEFIKCKLIRYVMENCFTPGEFWKKLQREYGIDSLIIPSPIHTVIVRDSFIISCDHLPILSFKKESATKLVTYRIDSALVYGLKEVAKEQDRSLTDVFKSALIE